MKLRQAKKIFNRVAAYESDFLRDSQSFLESVQHGEYWLKLAHDLSVAACGYSSRQVDAACDRLGRHLNRHPNFRREWLA